MSQRHGAALRDDCETRHGILYLGEFRCLMVGEVSSK